MSKLSSLILFFLFSLLGSLQVFSERPLTPVIGGLCRLGTADIQIGGKQTQFFLRCEPTVELVSGEGVWVVKSRNVGSPTVSQIPASMVVENSEASNQIPNNRQTPFPSKAPTRNYVCDLDPSAQENGLCQSNEQCLQPVFSDRTAFLHCDSTSLRWLKKHCQSGFTFDFERQACVMHANAAKSFRSFPTTTEPRPNDGLICTYAQCSASAPCSTGTCNNGYCCTPASALQPDSSPSNPQAIHMHSFRPADSQNPPNLPDNPTLMFTQDFMNDWTQTQYNEANQPELETASRKISIRSFADSEWQGNQNTCSSGFTSPLKCSHSSGECPAGLFCDTTAQRCCPLLLALPDDGKPTAQQPSSRHPSPLAKKSVVNSYQNIEQFQANRPRQRSTMSMGGNGASMPTLPDNGNGMRGVDSQTPTQMTPFHRFQRMLRQNQFNNQIPTTKTRRFCPGGTQPAGSCNGGYCPHSYQCIQPNNLCCFAAPPAAPPLAPAYACPGGLPALGQCIGGRCGPGYACAPASNACCAVPVPTAIPATVCPDGTQAAGACVNLQCGTGFTCNQGLCCSSSSQTPRCLDGSQAIGACIQGTCGTGYTCTTGNICCPSTLNACPGGATSIGVCVNGRCPPGFTCILPANQCCPDTETASSTPIVTCEERDSNGPCIDGDRCPEAGYLCDVANQRCCPQTLGEPVGPCILGEGGDRLCPDGFACVGGGDGECKRLDTKTCAPEDQAGPCGPVNQPPRCPDGFTCIEEFCCRNGSFRRRKRTSAFMRLVTHK